MIGSTRQAAVHAFAAPADMRKSFDSLSLLLAQGLGRDVLSGDLFLFVSKNRRRAKVLYWDVTTAKRHLLEAVRNERRSSCPSIRSETFRFR